jgi:hypothetical protein
MGQPIYASFAGRGNLLLVVSYAWPSKSIFGRNKLRESMKPMNCPLIMRFYMGRFTGVEFRFGRAKPAKRM